MEFQGFEWDDGNREKCQNHGLSLDEIESVFRHEINVMLNTRHLTSEARYQAVGITDEAKYVFVVFTLRTGAAGKLIRPISARYMHQKEIDQYESQTKTQTIP